MQTVISVLPYIQVVLSILLVGGILLQQRGAGMGGAFGGGDGFGFNTRRGPEKFFFYVTIIVGVLFVALALVNIIIQ